MPRMQVYLPDDLYRAVKEHGLGASKLLQGAIRVELRQRRLAEETERYLTELTAEVGEPGPEETQHAQTVARGLVQRASRVAG